MLIKDLALKQIAAILHFPLSVVFHRLSSLVELIHQDQVYIITRVHIGN